MTNKYMQEELFGELLNSVREGGAILRGEKEVSRTFTVEAPDVTLLSSLQSSKHIIK